MGYGGLWGCPLRVHSGRFSDGLYWLAETYKCNNSFVPATSSELSEHGQSENNVPADPSENILQNVLCSNSAQTCLEQVRN